MPKRHFWWLSYGNFSPRDELELRPDPGEVLAFFLDKQGIAPEKRAGALMKILAIKKDVAYAILKGDWFDSISRCRHLAEALSIPAALLALEGRYGQKPCWWKEQGYAFTAGPDGYPSLGEVLAYFRKQIMKEVNGVQHSWTQKDLADAMGLSEVTICKMENNHNLVSLDRISRREVLARIIHTSTKAPFIFALLGLDAQSFTSAPSDGATSPAIHLPHTSLDVTSLQTHKQIQQALFAEYFTLHGQEALEEARLWEKVVRYQVAPLAQGSQRIEVLELQSLYHQFFGDIAREQCRDDLAIFHLNKAVTLAQDAVKLTPKNSTVLLTRAKQLETSALLRRMEAHFEQGTFSAAKDDADKMLMLSSKMPVSQVQTHAFIDAGLAYAQVEHGKIENRQALSLFDQAEQLLLHQPFADDPFFIRTDKGFLYIRRAMALRAPHMAGNVLEALDTAEHYTDPQLARRRLLIDIFRAQALIDLKEYEQATILALSALEVSQQVRSRLNRDRIESLSTQLHATSYRGEPLLVRLQVQLQMWKIDG